MLMLELPIDIVKLYKSLKLMYSQLAFYLVEVTQNTFDKFPISLH
ncbi:Uncharacterised protein [Chlamydia trachomatis]|nr:hypothetical protein MYM_0495 [Mesomycoplasma hyorhinis GDL-1]CRH25373.1 Uncharacterised protein [Chlamydia trachomatis]